MNKAKLNVILKFLRFIIIFLIISIIYLVVVYIYYFIGIKTIFKNISNTYNKNNLIGIFWILLLQVVNCLLNLPFYLVLNVSVILIIKNLVISIIVICMTSMFSCWISYLVFKLFKKYILKKINKYIFAQNLKEAFEKNPWKTSILIKNSLLLGGMKNYILALFLKSKIIYFLSDIISLIFPLTEIIIVTKSIKSFDNYLNNKKFSYLDFMYLLIMIIFNVIWALYFKRIFKKNKLLPIKT